MKQETLCAFPVELFSTSDTAATSSKGECICAIVTLPSRPPKYSLVCYNAQQVTFCVARMNYVDARSTSLRLVVHASSGHISFTDDVEKRWSVYFADAAQQARFLAGCGVAFYVLSGASATSVFEYDLSFPSSSLHLELGDRAHMSFSSYELTERDNMYALGALGEHRGDAAGVSTLSQQPQPLYVFQPRASAAQLVQGCFGFEGSVVGMREDDVRVFVVPAGLTRRVSDSLVSVSTQGLVFVVRLVRVEHVREEPASIGLATGNGQGALPSVYAPTEVDEGSRLVPAPSEQALVVVGAPQTTTFATSSVPAFLSTSGIPVEHMSLLRKVELGVNAALATAQDVRDVTSIFSQNWQRYVDRPKPSLLSNRALLEQVQRVVEEEETTQEHLDQCDRTIQALEARNKELQQRMDGALKDSQRLLAEKNSAATKAMDERLVRDRQLVKLKDALLVKRQEQEDLQRHIGALQRTLEVSNEELRQVQGRLDIHQVTSASMAERLSAMQESLSEERRRNAALATKLSATEEGIHKAQAQRRWIDGQLTTARGLAERERLHYLQVMEDERSHRTTDADILRRDIVDELDARERQHQVDRHRLAEEQFMRGLRDGKVEGRNAAETDLQGHQDELRLNLQRAKTQVETHKEEVRRSIESAMALRRTLGGKVTALEEQLASATRTQTHLQYKLAQWQTRCRTARDTVSQHWRELVSYATHPCTQDELLAMMEEVRAAEQQSYATDDGEEGSDVTDGPVRVDLQFQLDLWRQTRIRNIAQRQRWLWDDMLDLYVKGAAYHYEHEWLKPLTVAHDATLEAVAQLYAQQHGGRMVFDCCVEEAQERWSVQQQWWSTVNQIEAWLAAQRRAQEDLKSEEAAARQALWKEFMRGGEAVVQLCASQLRAQVMLLRQEMQARDELASEEEGRRRQLPEEARQQWIDACSSALRLFEEEEEAVRAGVEAEAYTSFSGLQFQFAYALRTAQQRSVQHAEQQCLLADETAARQAVVQEATDALVGLRLAAATPPPTSAKEATAPQEEGGQTTTVLSSSAVATVCGEPSPPPVEEEADTSASPAATPLRATPAFTPPSPTHPVEGPTSTTEESALTTQRVNGAVPTPGAPAPPSHGDPTAVMQYADPSPPPTPPLPPSPPAAAPASDYADPPCTALACHSSGGGVRDRLGDEGLAVTAEMLFASVPPPLPPSNESDASAEAVAGSNNGLAVGSGVPGAFAALAPPPAHRRSPSEVEEVARGRVSELRHDSFSSEGTSSLSSSNSSSVFGVQRDNKTALPATASLLHHHPEKREGKKQEAASAAAADPSRQSSTRHNFPHALGTDSSDTDEAVGGSMAGGRRSQQLSLRVPCDASGLTSKRSASANQAKKPKLFDSSSRSGEDM
ncbi:hypothetical protein JKF63_02828 [Porcisia hertigi]|uniref:Uncharacterized protein n=1 Tax=Porcisia hertigi TaxID=2761500 RepID=A0A836I581_9TRYP|nr:hypothetical protein JKF63_02828 [Porcisia hertigi]